MSLEGISIFLVQNYSWIVTSLQEKLHSNWSRIWPQKNKTEPRKCPPGEGAFYNLIQFCSREKFQPDKLKLSQDHKNAPPPPPRPEIAYSLINFKAYDFSQIVTGLYAQLQPNWSRNGHIVS